MNKFRIFYGNDSALLQVCSVLKTGGQHADARCASAHRHPLFDWRRLLRHQGVPLESSARHFQCRDALDLLVALAGNATAGRYITIARPLAAKTLSFELRQRH